MAVIALMLYFGKPFIARFLSSPWDNILTAFLTILFLAPFLWMLMRQGDGDDARALWSDNRFNRAKLVALQLLRFLIAAAFVSYILGRTIHWGYTPGIFIAVAIVFSILFSRRLQKQGDNMEKTFTENLTQREEQQ